MKEFSLKAIFKKIIIHDFIFYISVLIWQISVYLINVYNQNGFYSIGFLIVSFVIWAISHYETRLVTVNNERFMGYKGYLMYTYKLLSILLIGITTGLCFLFTSNLLVMISISGVWVFIHWLILCLVIRKYDKLILDNRGIVYLNNSLIVEKWYIEGEIEKNEPDQDSKENA